jgi:hypothetical protein
MFEFLKFEIWISVPKLQNISFCMLQNISFCMLQNIIPKFLFPSHVPIPSKNMATKGGMFLCEGASEAWRRAMKGTWALLDTLWL